MADNNTQSVSSTINSDDALIDALSDADSSVNPLIRTFSNVTDDMGSEPKRHHAFHIHGAIFHAVNAVHQSYVSINSPDYIPSNYHEAVSCPDAHLWLAAIKKELNAHSVNHTWSLVPLPPTRRAIGCRWVFTIKDTTTPPTYKARLVAQGFRQIHGLDYTETFSPVVRYESIRVLFAIAAQFQLKIHQMDVTTAFLNGDLAEEIYMRVPPGITASPGSVCRLNKSIYGLKQAPLCWNLKINHVLVTAGFSRAVSEFGVYSKISGKHIVLVALYVDDLLILSNNDDLVAQVKKSLSSHFQMKDLGLASVFLGMQINQNSSAVSVHLSHYLKGFLSEFNMLDSNSVTTPLVPGFSLVPDGSPLNTSDAAKYRSMVGKLLFAANTVRPDLAFAASVLSRYIKEPHGNHLAGMKHVLRYIKGTLNLGLKYSKGETFKLVGYCDADWAGDNVDRKSTTGYLFMLSGAAITWRSTKQKTVALSSTEAEYMALGDAVKEILWLQQLLEHIGLKKTEPPIIYEDNEGCRMLSSHPSHHHRTKHIDIRHHFIRDHVNQNHCKIVAISTNNMVADVLTKQLARPKFEKFTSLAGMKP